MKKGFTLIELLAVIVILAIIALIATPIVLDIIEDSKNSSIKRSIELYADAVENSVAKAQLNGSVVPSGKYTTTDGKTLTNGNTTIKIDYNGAKTVCDVYISNEGTVSLKKCNVSDKDVEYTYGNKIYENGEVVYFNVDTGSKCISSEAVSTTGTKSGCMKFYAFNDDGEATVNLLLDHDTTAAVVWISIADYVAAGGTDLSNDGGACQGGGFCSTNEYGPLTVLAQLNNDTKSWVGTETPSNYTMDQSSQSSGASYTIDYSSYKSRLITSQEIATITGNTSWDEKTDESEWFYFDTNTTTASTTCTDGNTTGCSYGWLYDRTNESCTTYGCLNNSDQKIYGYWTASSRAYGSTYAWYVSDEGRVGSTTIDLSSVRGVRPVITVLKSKLS